MRDYGVVSPKFWIGDTGKALRGHLEAQVLALYLMTSPHATAIGVFHCPVMYMAHETGLGMEGASKGLAVLIEGGFCYYDEASETVFVKRMAAYQVAESLKPDDKRAKWIQKEYEKLPPGRIRNEFFAIYFVAFGLKDELQKSRGIQGASKPHASQEQEQEQEQEQDPNNPSGSSAAKLPPCPHQEIIGLYAQHLPMLPQPKPGLWTGQRAKHLSARWKWLLTTEKKPGELYAKDAAEALHFFARMFAYVAKSDFLTGRTGKFTGCDLGWLSNEENFAKVLQGNYENREAA